MDVTGQTTTLPAKRKRKQVSYADLDDEYELEQDAEFAVAGDANEMPAGETEYGCRKKAKKLKIDKKTAKSKSKAPSPKNKAFKFLQLPAELRDYIYKLALVDPTGVSLVFQLKNMRRIVKRGSSFNRWGRRRGWRRFVEAAPDKASKVRLSPNLLAVNKQINLEAAGHLYQQPIILEDTRALCTFLSGLGTANKALLHTVIVNGWGTGAANAAVNSAALAALAPCVNLKKLVVDCYFSYWRTGYKVAKQIFRDGHYFLEAYGAANGSKHAAVEVLEVKNRDKHLTRQGHAVTSDVWSDEFKQSFQKQLRHLLK